MSDHKTIVALEFDDLMAMRRQSERTDSLLFFKIIDGALVSIEPETYRDGDYDLAIGRTAVYLAAPADSVLAA